MMMMNKPKVMRVCVMRLLWVGFIMKIIKNGDVTLLKKLKKFKKKLYIIKNF
jgi:hypothetical protein